MTPRRAGRGAVHRTERNRRRLVRATQAATCTFALAVGLTACANRDGTELAQQACRHVDRSLALYQASLRAPNATVAGAKQNEAMDELRDAMPIAATAAGEAGQFQGLMSTLAESDHLPESLLVHALTEQCTAADSKGEIVGSPAPIVTSSSSPAAGGS
jgi:hypothetical protein